MGFNIGPKIVRATGGSISRVGNYRIHQFPTNFVTEGLIGHFDAGNTQSYPLHGTTWNDISGAGIMGNGTFNGNYLDPGSSGTRDNFVSANGGYHHCNQNISCNWSGDQTFPPLTTLTGEMWLRFRGASTGGFHVLFQKDGGYSGGEVYGLRANDNYSFTSTIWWGGGSGENGQSQSTTTYSVDTWLHAVVRFDENRTLRIFVNGDDASTTAGTGDYIPRQNTGGGNIGTGDSRYCNADIAIFRLYNRALSNAEIAQNYNAEKLRFHAYTDNFTPYTNGNNGKVEALCVAGGGGGGGYAGGGGGGAGGLLYNSSYTVSNSTAVAVTVGMGGTGGSYANAHGSGRGGNSTFGTLTSIGGGGGRSWGQSNTSRDGGSGGGWHELTNNHTDEANGGGNGTAGQGFKGGGAVKLGNNTESGGGGGGAGGVGNGTGEVAGGNPGNSLGTAGSVIYAGNGGPGLAYNISGTTKYYAGGGGGGGYSSSELPAGMGGSGVGGNGGHQAANTKGTHAIPNTGSGGGAGGDLYTEGGHGSNGIVIVRYPAEDYNAELLVVAGGGGGGGSTSSNGGGGGGGAGGVLYYSSYALSSGKNYLVNVGAAGTAGTGSAAASQGRGSNFGIVKAIGGGGGDRGNGGDMTATSGGSGGGAGYNGYNGADTHGAKGTVGQGHDGATVSTGGSAGGAGGGGAGGDGKPNRSGHAGGYGGDGLTLSISGTSFEYGIGGQGGGGSDNARANSGDGGDGIYAQSTGGDSVAGRGYHGGTGVVIVAYKGPQRGEGGTVSTTARPGYTTHTFTSIGPHRFIA